MHATRPKRSSVQRAIPTSLDQLILKGSLMRKITSLMLLAALSVAAAAAANEPENPPFQMPSTMTGAEIDVHNEGRGATDADYIRCRRMDVPGSLVKKLRVCKTNTEWRQYSDKGNQDARDSMAWIERGFSNSVEPKDDVLQGGYNAPK